MEQRSFFSLTLSVGLKVRFILIYIKNCASVAKYFVCGCCCSCFINIFFVCRSILLTPATQNVAKRFIYTYMHTYEQFYGFFRELYRKSQHAKLTVLSTSKCLVTSQTLTFVICAHIKKQAKQKQIKQETTTMDVWIK